jgi:hypothetical protein
LVNYGLDFIISFDLFFVKLFWSYDLDDRFCNLTRVNLGFFTVYFFCIEFFLISSFNNEFIEN